MGWPSLEHNGVLDVQRHPASLLFGFPTKTGTELVKGPLCLYTVRVAGCNWVIDVALPQLP